MNTSEILNSDIYSKYKEICSIIENDEEINNLLQEIKKLQNKSVFLEYNNDLSFLEVEKEILEKQKELISARTEALKSAKRIEELYTEAIKAMRNYGGHGDPDEY